LIKQFHWSKNQNLPNKKMLSNEDFRNILKSEKKEEKPEPTTIKPKKHKKRSKKKPDSENISNQLSNYRDRAKERREYASHEDNRPIGLDPKLKEQIFQSSSEDEGVEDDQQEM
jgi:hypothetical protein